MNNGLTTTSLNQLAILCGVIRYEFQMQLRRRAVWITVLLLSLLLVLLFTRLTEASSIVSMLDQFPILTAVAYWAGITNYLLPLAAGCLLADRLVRDRRFKVAEIFTTMPAALSTRLLGKYLGSLFATLVPVLVFYLMGIGYIFYQTHNWLAFPLGLETFATIILPGMLFVAAFSLACPLVMWVPLYQFCFIGYWFWGNFLGTGLGIPTISETILTPVGGYIAKGFYGVDLLQHFTATPLEASESILALVGVALLVLVALWSLFRWQQTRE
jgi:ABC-2 type transport system permease protein